MDPRIPDLAESLLLGAPARSLTLLAICDTLARQPGVAAPSLFELAGALERDPRFCLAAEEDPLDALGEDWSEDVRDAYRTHTRGPALRHARVSLRAAPPDPDPLSLVSGSLRTLVERDDPGVADRVREARAEYSAIRHVLEPVD